MFYIPPVFIVLIAVCFSSGEHMLCRQVVIVGERIGKGGVQCCFASSELGVFCNEPPLRLCADDGDERLLMRDVCNVSHGRS